MLYIPEKQQVNNDIPAVASRPPEPLHPDRAVAMARDLLKTAKRGYAKQGRHPYANERKLRRKQHAISSALAVLQVCRWKNR
jgi:hypothetical protein